MAHYYAIAERGQGRTWWISFPGRDGIVSAADDAGDIIAQAQDALASAAMHEGAGCRCRSRKAPSRRRTCPNSSSLL